MSGTRQDRQTDRETHTDSPERVTYDTEHTDEWYEDRQTDSPERVAYDTEPTDERYENVLDEESNERHGRVQVLWDTGSVTVVVQSIL